MHELSLCQAVIDTVDGHAKGRNVRRVTVRIGHLRQVVPDSLQFSWEILVDGTPLAGCELEIDHVPAVVVCAMCAERTTLDLPVLMCGSCGSFEVRLISGEEFLIVAMDVADERDEVPSASERASATPPDGEGVRGHSSARGEDVG
jgi:hydrogenase nickel incorporation protein HypA/HybF